MTDKQQPEALRLADDVDEVARTYPDMAEVSAELRRQHAELETLTLYKNLADEYGLSIFPDIAEMTTELETLRTGYAAARREIESLKAQLHAAKQINAAQFVLLAASIPGSALPGK